MQQNQPGHRQLQLTMLRPWTQHPEKDTQRALQLQIPLVLLCAMRGVPSHGVGQCVQVACLCWPLPMQESRWWACPVAHPCGIVQFPVSSLENLFIPPSLWFHLSSGIYFLLDCYSDNAKSEIKEVNHVIHLALVCLDLPLSAMKKAKTPFIFLNIRKQRRTTAEEPLSSLSTILILWFCMLLYMHICKCIININV